MIPSKLNRIKLLLLDVDGVLTSGHIIYSNAGMETKAFHVRDGLGIKLLMNAGIEVAFMGDDLPDISLLKKIGVSIAVADAHESVKKSVDIITHKKGGNGAVREVCEMILKANGLWDNIIKNCI